MTRLPERTLVVAHRGFHKEFPENTIPAFEAAAELGVDMVELDVQETVDGRLVVHHGESIAGVKVAATTYARLRRLVREPLLPPLEEVVERIGTRVTLNVEIKTASKEQLRNLVAVADRRHVLTSFDADCVRSLGDLAAHVRRGLIVDDKQPAGDHGDAAFADATLRLALRARADFVVLPADSAAPSVIGTLADTLSRPFVWAANARAELERLLGDPNVEGVITDQPELALAIQGRRGSA